MGKKRNSINLEGDKGVEGKYSAKQDGEVALQGIKSTGNEGTANGVAEANGVIVEGVDTEVEVKDDKKKARPMVSFFGLFRYADGLDKLFMFLGTLGAIGTGVAFPMNLLIYGNVMDTFIGDSHRNTSVNGTGDNLFNRVSSLALWYVMIGGIVLITGYFQISCWCIATERQTRRIRFMFFNSVMKQNIGWFDTHQSGELTTRLSDDINTIHDGLGDKIACFIQWISTFFAGYIIGFVRGWKLTLVVIATAPLIILCAGFMARLIRNFTMKEVAAYSKAGAIAQEVLSAIKTVSAFSGQEREVIRYTNNLHSARALGIRKGVVAGGGSWVFFTVIFSTFALAFWYGGELVRTDGYSPGTILQVFFGILIGSMSLGHAAPNIEALASARGAALQVFNIIEQVSEIDSSSEEGEKPETVEGNLELCDVNFIYPARPDVQVLKGLSMKIQVGQTVALVGPSGCGKSTVVQLLLRFYDPLSGVVKLDGRDVRSLNVAWLRQNIGVVSQEPILFGTTISENIRYGQEGVTDEEIKKAAMEANAHDYISKLPDKYNTIVGDRGAQLSGGQKQRIAIARALVRNPKVLLLDEATSALDTESESVVQEALDKASQGRTTLVIAHRLSTIKNADRIIAIQDGVVSEMGTHDSLMEKEGLYYHLVTSQTKAEKKEENDEEIEAAVVSAEDLPPKLERTNSWRWSLKRQTSNLSSGTRKRYDSMSSNEEKPIEEVEEKLPEPPLKRIMRLNAPEWPYLLVGSLTAIVSGAVHPGFAIVFSEIVGTFTIRDPQERANATAMYSGIMAAFGVVAGIFIFIRNSCFAKSGEELTMRLRQMAFRAMLKQEMAWFDEPANQVGALTTRLATSASMVKGATGSRLATIMEAISNAGIAILIAFIFGWKLAFVTVAFLPFLVATGFIQGRMITGYSQTDKDALEDGGKIASDAIANIRTVASLTRETLFISKYQNHFNLMYSDSKKKSHIMGAAYGFSQSIIFFAYAAVFTYGSYLVQRGEMQFVNVLRVMSAIIFGGQALGRMTSFQPDYAKAKLSAAQLFKLFDRESKIDPTVTSGEKPETCSGAVSFSNVEFVYPQRPDAKVLNGLSLSVEPGQMLALVGSSGCGKSTAVQLIEHFYEPDAGTICVDHQNMHLYNLQWLRSQIGIVSQEPVLFDASIRDNIAYGDNSREVEMSEIIQAAREANIHSFIESLPHGYDTNVGDKGTQLSGGQKQRVAIARALVRNPKILLLDEATSALDTESEKVVQEALDKAQKGRTSIVIAHRLSTIQNADKIAVIHHGKVLECGTHDELMANKALYYTLNQAQRRTKKDQ